MKPPSVIWERVFRWLGWLPKLWDSFPFDSTKNHPCPWICCSLTASLLVPRGWEHKLHGHHQLRGQSKPCGNHLFPREHILTPVSLGFPCSLVAHSAHNLICFCEVSTESTLQGWKIPKGEFLYFFSFRKHALFSLHFPPAHCLHKIMQ